jgi:hypothetical protein
MPEVKDIVKEKILQTLMDPTKVLILSKAVVAALIVAQVLIGDPIDDDSPF